MFLERFERGVIQIRDALSRCHPSTLLRTWILSEIERGRPLLQGMNPMETVP